MDYRKKLVKVVKHIENNPNDYESVISMLKINSKAIEHGLKHRRNMMLKKLSEVRNGEQA